MGERPHVKRPIGSKYYISVRVTNNVKPRKLLDSFDLIIMVSKRNRYPPQFDRAPYNLFVSRYTEVGASILKVETTDKDEDAYNKDTSLRLQGVENGRLRLNSSSGVVSVARSFLSAPPVIYGSIEAYNTHGSPFLRREAPLKVLVCDTSGKLPV